MALQIFNKMNTKLYALTISNMSNDLNQEISKLENLLSMIKREWYGPASDEFQKQLTMLIADMKTTSYSMRNVSDEIRNVVDENQ